MTYRGYTPAQGEANARYAAKTFKKINIALRMEEDSEIIDSCQESHDHGITSREWLTDLFYASGDKSRVEAALKKHGVQPNIIKSILNEL